MSQASFPAFMDALCELEMKIVEQVDGGLNPYRWREPQTAFPAIYNRFGQDGTVESPDQCAMVETFSILVVIMPAPAQHHGADLRVIEPIIDVARAVIDPVLLHKPDSLGGARASRGAIRPIADTFGDAAVNGLAIPLRVVLSSTYLSAP